MTPEDAARQEAAATTVKGYPTATGFYWIRFRRGSMVDQLRGDANGGWVIAEVDRHNAFNIAISVGNAVIEERYLKDIIAHVHIPKPPR